MVSKELFASILDTLTAGNVVSAEFTGEEKFLSGTYTVTGTRLGPGRGGVRYVKVKAKNGAEIELSNRQFGAKCESITVGYGAVEISVVSKVAGKVGRGVARLPPNA